MSSTNTPWNLTTYLHVFEVVTHKVLLQLLICKVNAQLFEAVGLEAFKAIDIKDTDCFVDIRASYWRVDSIHEPVEQPAWREHSQNFSAFQFNAITETWFLYRTFGVMNSVRLILYSGHFLIQPNYYILRPVVTLPYAKALEQYSEWFQGMIYPPCIHNFHQAISPLTGFDHVARLVKHAMSALGAVTSGDSAMCQGFLDAAWVLRHAKKCESCWEEDCSRVAGIIFRGNITEFRVIWVRH